VVRRWAFKYDIGGAEHLQLVIPELVLDVDGFVSGECFSPFLPGFHFRRLQKRLFPSVYRCTSLVYRSAPFRCCIVEIAIVDDARDPQDFGYRKPAVRVHVDSVPPQPTPS